jgi:methylmalonyl-CoA mutase
VVDSQEGVERAQVVASLAREIQQLRAVAVMLQEGKPEKARAAQACLDLAQQREAKLTAQEREFLVQAPQGDIFIDHGALILQAQTKAQ